jgi:hypothetical protein
MNTTAIRKQIHKRIDTLSDDAVEQIADFTLFIMARKHIAPDYGEWAGQEWQDFTLIIPFLD